MTFSPPISDRSHPLRARWLAARNDRTRNASFDSQLLATSVLAPSMQIVTFPPQPHQRVATNQLPFSLRTELYRSHATRQIPIAPAAPPAHYLTPRFVPWRFSNAGRRRACRVRAHRRSKTCT